MSGYIVVCMVCNNQIGEGRYSEGVDIVGDLCQTCEKTDEGKLILIELGRDKESIEYNKQREYNIKMYPIASSIYANYRTISSYQPVIRIDDQFETELRLSRDNYRTHIMKDSINTLVTSHSDKFSDQYDFQMLISHFRIFEELQDKYSEMTKSLLFSGKVPSRDELYQLESLYDRESLELSKIVENAFIKLFSKSTDKLTFNEMAYQYHMNRDYY